MHETGHETRRWRYKCKQNGQSRCPHDAYNLGWGQTVNSFPFVSCRHRGHGLDHLGNIEKKILKVYESKKEKRVK